MLLVTSCLLVQEFATQQVQGTEDNWKVPEANQNPQTQGGTETVTSSCFSIFMGRARPIRCHRKEKQSQAHPLTNIKIQYIFHITHKKSLTTNPKQKVNAGKQFSPAKWTHYKASLPFQMAYYTHFLETCWVLCNLASTRSSDSISQSSTSEVIRFV